MDTIEKYLSLQPKIVPAVVGYLVRNGEILLGERIRVSHGLGKLLFSGIGGKIGDLPGNEHESAEQALEREFREEVTISITSYHHMGHAIYLYPHKPLYNQSVSIYMIDRWQGEPQNTDAIRPRWFNQAELP